MELNWPAERIPAITNIWQACSETGNAVANLFFEDVGLSRYIHQVYGSASHPVRELNGFLASPLETA
jgi:hypothetical protein